MRRRRIVILGAAIFLLFSVYSLLKSRSGRPRLGPLFKGPAFEQQQVDASVRKPKPAPGGDHPIWHLMKEAEREHEAVKARQSRTLPEAVAEYRRRYGLPPPPNFDKWWAFAKSRNVQLVDDFDTIMDVMTPFWGLKPATIRGRVVESLGFDNALMAVQVRGGNITDINDGFEWLQEAVRGMTAPFIQHLPDMDLAFNIHDEPRVMVPHDDMTRLLGSARHGKAAANAVPTPSNAFSTTQDPPLTDGHGRLPETKLTRFNQFAHQPIWTPSRMSCPPETPARALEEEDRVDEVGRYALGELGFVYNVTAMSDVCLSPSLRTTHGFFERPNAFNVVDDLFPVFSQSKMSSYADILFPSPWYWYDKVPYEEEKDVPWTAKEDKLYWRGSTTGGFSRNGGWRRQHRQRFVQNINAANAANIMVNRGRDSQAWAVKQVPRGDFKDLIDVAFSHVGQCDPGDCDAQKDFFTIKDRAEQQDAWRYKYLLDMDGNAFSGRFYAFLRSRSMVYKWAVFREWHYEWVRPWVHYIPLSLRGDDWLEAVRFFGDGTLGKREAERMAVQGRDWANKVLRKEDMEVWLFRLLLEYGRVVDDDRQKIGYAP